MAPHSFFLCTLLTFSLSFHGISSAVNYIVTNEFDLSERFPKDIGIPYTKEVMGKSNNFLWSTIFKQNTPADRKPVDSVHVIIKRATTPTPEVVTSKNQITFNSYILDSVIPTRAFLKWTFTSLLYHEMAHVFQWNGEGKCLEALVEGIADYAMLKANYSPENFAKPGWGKNGTRLRTMISQPVFSSTVRGSSQGLWQSLTI
ncbi:hypothetical protein L1987_27027 [Smallanthus sonchifolius]|uniref:Uncharacterized protein n=1 Tax=Smallanthus sonchifolius TaxID=185202 RepID=A0ACB9IC36_9ASTR|nr:hypothetical protein L1987_27027 [Smallanthus sonchifolius]